MFIPPQLASICIAFLLASSAVGASAGQVSSLRNDTQAVSPATRAPEPGSLALLGLGLLAIVRLHRRKR